MESLNDHIVDERETESCGARLAAVQSRIVLKLRGAAARIYEPDRNQQLPTETSAIGTIGAQTSALLHQTADCIERFNPKTIKADVTEQVQRNPGISLLVAGAVGFILSAMLRRR